MRFRFLVLLLNSSGRRNPRDWHSTPDLDRDQDFEASFGLCPVLDCTKCALLCLNQDCCSLSIPNRSWCTQVPPALPTHTARWARTQMAGGQPYRPALKKGRTINASVPPTHPRAPTRIPEQGTNGAKSNLAKSQEGKKGQKSEGWILDLIWVSLQNIKKNWNCVA